MSAPYIIMSSMNSLEADMSYLGLTNILASSTVDYEEILADIEGEQETVPDLTAEDFEPQEGSTADSIGLPPQWEKAISSVGKGVTDSTHNEYIRSVFFKNKSLSLFFPLTEMVDYLRPPSNFLFHKGLSPNVSNFSQKNLKKMPTSSLWHG
jgi:hypothetical protein